MERDFFGLNSREPLPTVQEEEIKSDGFKEIGFNKSSGIKWPFPNKVSAPPHVMTFKLLPEDKARKVASDLFESCEFMSVPRADAHEPSQRHPRTETPKLFSHDRHGASHFSLTTYPVQHDVISVHHPHEMKMFPVSNPRVPLPMRNFFLNEHRGTTGQYTIAAMKPELFGGAAISAPQTLLPPTVPIPVPGTGTTESCAKATGSLAPLTIFYAGTVNVFDDISPEMARAIMFLAGSQSSIAPNLAQQKLQVQAPNPAADDINLVNQSIATPRCSRLSSPLSVSSQTGVHSRSGSTSAEDTLVTAKSTGLATTDISKPEPPKMASALVSATAVNMIPSVPQARKASLARFLEKRKERMMSTAPYSLGKKPELPPQNVM